MAPETHGEAAATGGGLRTRWVELVVALLICAGGALVIKDSLRIGAKWGSDGPEAGYFPFLTGTCLLLSGGWIALSALWRWRKLEGALFVEWAKLKPVLEMLLPTIAYVALIKFTGIYVASAVFIGAFMVWKGRYRAPAMLAVALGVPIAMFLLFEIWFLVPLPKGPLENLLGY
ncbi:MAG: tripartite tricarboxylate transporter TctB family protein [Betaproteobacteria bacterium]